VVACAEEGGSELASDDDLNLSSFSESDLTKLTDCLDWLIGSASADDEAPGSKTSDGLGGGNADRLIQADDKMSLQSNVGEIQYSFISTNLLDCSFMDQASNTASSVPRKSATMCTTDKFRPMFNDIHEQSTTNLTTCDGSYVQNANDLIESLISCASPTSSSGCESDFSASSSSYGDEHFLYNDDLSFATLTDDSFTDLFPELY